MATAIQRKTNKAAGMRNFRQVNAGKVAKGKPSGFGTRDQKRQDLRTAFYVAGLSTKG